MENYIAQEWYVACIPHGTFSCEFDNKILNLYPVNVHYIKCSE